VTAVPGDPIDPGLIDRARAGDHAAFTELVHEATGKLRRIAGRILADPDTAEDVLQTALMTIWRELPRLRDSACFDGWAYRIVVNACYEEAPRSRRWMAADRELPADRADPSDHSRTLADRDELERAFRAIPPDQRAVFVLHHHVGMPLVLVAESLGIPNGTARSRLHYATRALRAAFESGRRERTDPPGAIERPDRRDRLAFEAKRSALARA
jgi:RNA polymerase sigma-70 factor (ECF subfamily)